MDDEDQFETLEEGILHSQYTVPAQQSELQEDEKVRLPYPSPIMGMHNPPMGWMGNYVKEHNPEGDPCFCQHCYRTAYPFLEVGPPVQVHPAYPVTTDQMQVIVGLYDSRFVAHLIPCSVCGEKIDVKEDGAAKGGTVMHVSCAPDGVRETLKAMGYVLPYVVVQSPTKVDHGG